MLWRRALPAAVGALALLSAAPAIAYAEELFTSQASRIGAEASTWAPPAARPAAICLVDTGVDTNPDTSSVVARLAVDGGAGEDVGASKHGTMMAMIAAAPRNGWGMVGIAPGQPVVSIRAQRETGGGFLFDDVRAAIVECRRIAPEHNIRVINLSLGARGNPSPSTLAALADAVDAARARGISVVAAAGNVPGPVESPASYPPVVSVGAAAADGALCAFAAGPADVVAPGCGLDVVMTTTGAPAWAQGSSESSIQVAAVLAQLYSHRPDLAPDAAEQMVFRSARGTEAGLAVNVAALWRAAGLAEQLQAGADARPAPDPEPRSGGGGLTPQPPVQQPPITLIPGHTDIDPPDATPRSRWPRPRVLSVRYRRGIATITTSTAPRGAALTLRFTGRTRRKAWTRTVTGHGPRWRVKLPGDWRRATLQLRGIGRSASAVANIRPPSPCATGCRRR
jgi:Subtilase family